MLLSASITSLEKLDGWSKVVGPSINPTSPNGYEIVPVPGGLKLFCCGPKYSGWLAKHVAPLVYPFQNVWMAYTLTIDDATLVCAQVIETDTKITDADGFTYDLSAQWNLAENWMFQVDTVDGHWIDTGIQIQALKPGVPAAMSIGYKLDYKNKVSSVVCVVVDGKQYTVPAGLGGIPAKQSGWGPNGVVTQLQQCINGQEGAYAVTFSSIRYDFAGA